MLLNEPRARQDTCISDTSRFLADALEEEKTTRLIAEKAKDRIIVEFLSFMLGNVSKDELRSNIDTHDVPVKIMSGVCQSSACLTNNQNPLIRVVL